MVLQMYNPTIININQINVTRQTFNSALVLQRHLFQNNLKINVTRLCLVERAIENRTNIIINETNVPL